MSNNEKLIHLLDAYRSTEELVKEARHDLHLADCNRLAAERELVGELKRIGEPVFYRGVAYSLSQASGCFVQHKLLVVEE
jgi:hypothetical protein